MTFVPLHGSRGRRESRVPIAPMGPVQQKSTGVGPQVNRSNPGFPCAMVYGLLRALPGDRACLPPSPPWSLLREKLDASVGAPGPHDFAVRVAHARPSRAPASTASHRNVRDVRNAPLIGRDGRIDITDLPDGGSGIFLHEGLDMVLVICPSGYFVAGGAGGFDLLARRSRPQQLPIISPFPIWTQNAAPSIVICASLMTAAA